ncbi:hypothetical protein ACJMK2_029776 [Sinanodonta woodiana]
MKTILFTILSFLISIDIACGECSTGWTRHERSCYHFSHDKEEWPSAQFFCNTLGGYLAEVQDGAEASFLENQVNLLQSTDTQFWIGGSDVLVEGEWVWMTSKTRIDPQVLHWGGPGRPSNTDNNENCLTIAARSEWNDAPCSLLFHYICEMESG